MSSGTKAPSRRRAAAEADEDSGSGSGSASSTKAKAAPAAPAASAASRRRRGSTPGSASGSASGGATERDIRRAEAEVDDDDDGAGMVWDDEVVANANKKKKGKSSTPKTYSDENMKPIIAKLAPASGKKVHGMQVALNVMRAAVELRERSYGQLGQLGETITLGEGEYAVRIANTLFVKGKDENGETIQVVPRSLSSKVPTTKSNGQIHTIEEVYETDIAELKKSINAYRAASESDKEKMFKASEDKKSKNKKGFARVKETPKSYKDKLMKNLKRTLEAANRSIAFFTAAREMQADPTQNLVNAMNLARGLGLTDEQTMNLVIYCAISHGKNLLILRNMIVAFGAAHHAEAHGARRKAIVTYAIALWRTLSTELFLSEPLPTVEQSRARRAEFEENSAFEIKNISGYRKAAAAGAIANLYNQAKLAGAAAVEEGTILVFGVDSESYFGYPGGFQAAFKTVKDKVRPGDSLPLLLKTIVDGDAENVGAFLELAMKGTTPGKKATTRSGPNQKYLKDAQAALHHVTRGSQAYNLEHLENFAKEFVEILKVPFFSLIPGKPVVEEDGAYVQGPILHAFLAPLALDLSQGDGPKLAGAISNTKKSLEAFGPKKAVVNLMIGAAYL